MNDEGLYCVKQENQAYMVVLCALKNSDLTLTVIR